MNKKNTCAFGKKVPLYASLAPNQELTPVSPCTTQTPLFCLRRRRRRMSKLAPFSSRCDEKSGLWASEIFKIHGFNVWQKRFDDPCYFGLDDWVFILEDFIWLICRTFIRVPWVWAKILGPLKNDEPVDLGKAPDTNISNMALGQGNSSSQTVQIP